MKIYKLQPVPDKYAGLVLTNDGDWAWLRDKFIGDPITDWKAPEVEVFSEQINWQFSDYINLSPAIPVFSDTAAKGLGDLLSETGQFLPLKFHGNMKLTAFNVTQVIDVLDSEKSDIEYFSDGVRAKRVLRYVFFGKSDFPPIFKIPQTKRSTVYVTDSFVKRVEQLQLTGFMFKLLWQSGDS